MSLNIKSIEDSNREETDFVSSLDDLKQVNEDTKLTKRPIPILNNTFDLRRDSRG